MKYIKELLYEIYRYLHLTRFGKKFLKMNIVPNPLHNGSIRNSPCVCNSGRKIKYCCGINPYVTEKFAKEIVLTIRKDMALNAN